MKPYDNEFDLHVNGPTGRKNFSMNIVFFMKTCFDTDLSPNTWPALNAGKYT